ncbi:MAG: Asp-tRNA(Asn)/Glu-tRNA(Gln) amidotransferase subunit GatB [Candidatus Colwellbacteria bacterium]|nr:Asp-tRNA(Asn)/Glu-tRNA(Gln) amidotransferase subunit GatB [Candidatus Colwellbacteria bacterium]
MNKYKTTIGLEVHAELKTRTKMFCACPNNPYNIEPNTNVCPVCLAHPGTLPVINEEAIRSILKVGLVLGGKIIEHPKFDRKSYFYPDLPKGYQISQYDLPLISGGELAGIKLERIHLEEDTGRLTHIQAASLVDYNRAGVPLMELVTKPAINSAEKALEFAKELQLLLRYLGVSDADMEKGQMRVEANISISLNRRKLGTKVELKNINSFKAVKDAIASEVGRQTELLGKGEGIVQETRGWNEDKKISFSQRIKEEADDYRYMPEPDLPPLDFTATGSPVDIKKLRLSLPEMPWEKRRRFSKEYGLQKDSDELGRLIKDRGEAEFFEEVISEIGRKEKGLIRLIVNYIDSDLVGLMIQKKIGWAELKVTPENFAELMLMLHQNEITSKVAKAVLEETFTTGVDPHQIIGEQKLTQISNEQTILLAVEEVIRENSDAAARYKAGKEQALKFLVGQTMIKLSGRGNPALVEQLLREHLSK